jgi:hypothetical protein
LRRCAKRCRRILHRILHRLRLDRSDRSIEELVGHVVGVFAGGQPLDLRLPADIEVVFDLDPVLAPGDTVLLIGYWEGAVQPGPAIIPARVVDPLLISVPDEIICVEHSSSEVLAGMSGGAAVVWDAERGRAVVVGLYRGMRQLDGLGRTWAGVHTVRRIPDAALTE